MLELAKRLAAKLTHRYHKWQHKHRRLSTFEIHESMLQRKDPLCVAVTTALHFLEADFMM
jgi:hypothetical protein